MTARFVSTLWFAAALVLTTATQLRLTGLPVGPGEVMLGIWCAGAALRIVLHGRISTTPVVRATFYFWMLALVLLMAGATVAFLRGVTPPRAGHDAMAFFFTASATLLYLARRDAQARAGYTLQVMMLLTVCVVGFLFVYGRWASRSLGPADLWYSSRFRALSQNPNQLALLLSPVPFVALHLAGAARSTLRRVGFLLCIPVTVFIGIQTRSDALMVSWVGAAALFGVLAWTAALGSGGRSHARALLIYGVIPVATLALVTVYGPPLYLMMLSQGAGVYDYNNQGSVRLLLYANGVRAIATSPLVGLGPGAHSGIMGPFSGSEAHNTFIDWGASTGALGVAAYVLLVSYLALRAWRAREPVLLVAIATALAFSVFHYVMRHPVFWFYLVSLELLAQPPLAKRTVREGRPDGRLAAAAAAGARARAGAS